MSLTESGITHKKVGEMRVAGIRFRGERKDIPAKCEILSEVCKKYVCGPAICVYDYGVYTDGVEIEVCFPVTEPVENNEVKTRMLEPAEVLSITHYGSHANVRDSYQKLYGYFTQHGIAGTSFGREIYLKFNPSNPEENVTEVQAVLHKWDDRLAKNVGQVLGAGAREKIMQGSDTLFTLESTTADKVKWVSAAVQKLDEIATNDEKVDILSRCAHDFSEKRIANLRAIYERNKDVDEVLKAMRDDPLWYEDPVRKGDIIYVTKVPYNRKGCEEAKSVAEKKRNYCHCPMIRDHLDEIPSTFCNCGAGWYRQIWEGILGRPVRVENLKSLPRGDDTCEFAIHLSDNVMK